MRTAVFLIAISTVAVLSLSGNPSPRPVQAAPVVIDHSADLAALKAEIETLRTELQAASVPPVATVPVATAGGGTVVCQGGVCHIGPAVAKAPVRAVQLVRKHREGVSEKVFLGNTRFRDGDGRPFRKAK